MNDQQALVNAIFSTDNPTQIEEQGLSIYRNNLKANALQALKVSFPTVEKLIGEELFAHSVNQLLVTQPPSLGDWGLWGSEYSDLLGELTALEDYPYVKDIAKLDYQLHLLSRAKDCSVNIESISMLGSHELDNIRLVMSPNIRLLESEFPIVEIYRANTLSECSTADCEKVSAVQYLNQAKLKIAAGLGQKVLMYRPMYKPLVREIEPTELHWLKLMSAGQSIGNALDEMNEKFTTDQDKFVFEEWLPKAIQDNLISHIEEVDC